MGNQVRIVGQKVATDWLPRQIQFLKEHRTDGTPPPKDLFEPEQEQRIRSHDTQWMQRYLAHLELINAGDGVGG